MYIHPFVSGVIATLIIEVALLFTFVIVHGNKVANNGKH